MLDVGVAQLFGILAIASIILLVGFLVLAHFWTTDRHTDSIGLPDKKYMKYLKKKAPVYEGLTEIHPPPDGKRDEEVEALLISGDFKAADELLMFRMEDARLAPIGREARIARVSHYIELLKNAQAGKHTG